MVPQTMTHSRVTSSVIYSIQCLTAELTSKTPVIRIIKKILNYDTSEFVQKKQNVIKRGDIFGRFCKSVKFKPPGLKNTPDRHAWRPARLRVNCVGFTVIKVPNLFLGEMKLIF